MDFVQIWETLRLWILIAVVVVVLFFIYYGFIASTGKARIGRAKVMAKKMIESGEIPDEPTFNYVYYMLQRVPYDSEAIDLLKALQQLKRKSNIPKPS